jgi:hypothetical protein
MQRNPTILCSDECTEGVDAGKHPSAGAVPSAQMSSFRDETIVGIFGVLLQSSPGKAGSHSFLENFYRYFFLFDVDARTSEILNAPTFLLQSGRGVYQFTEH